MADLRVARLRRGRVVVEATSVAGRMFLCDGDLAGSKVALDAHSAQFILRRAREVGLDVADLRAA